MASSHRILHDTKLTREHNRSSGSLAHPTTTQRRHALATPLDYLESVLSGVVVLCRSTTHCTEQKQQAAGGGECLSREMLRDIINNDSSCVEQIMLGLL